MKFNILHCYWELPEIIFPWIYHGDIILQHKFVRKKEMIGSGALFQSHTNYELVENYDMNSCGKIMSPWCIYKKIISENNQTYYYNKNMYSVGISVILPEFFLAHLIIVTIFIYNLVKHNRWCICHQYKCRIKSQI